MSVFAIRTLRTKTDRVVRANLSFLMIEVLVAVHNAFFAETSLIIWALLPLLDVPHHSNETLCCIKTCVGMRKGAIFSPLA